MSKLKIDHASITVKNMDESIDFYCKTLGLSLVSRREIPENDAEIAFVAGFEGDKIGLELTFWRNKKDWTEGDQLDHIAFTVDNVRKAIEDFRTRGVEVAKEPYSLVGSKSTIAFIKDPNGIWLELIQR
jgi:lactoylglutathione lyase